MYTLKISDSAYSVRLFPGSYLGKQWGMDFVNTASGEPVNSPLEYELWTIPQAETGFAPRRVYSIEKINGVRHDAMRPGAERFHLKDGETYLLKFPRRKNIRFRVPMRRERVVPVEQTHVDEEKWQLPEILYP